MSKNTSTKTSKLKWLRTQKKQLSDEKRKIIEFQGSISKKIKYFQNQQSRTYEKVNHLNERIDKLKRKIEKVR